MYVFTEFTEAVGENIYGISKYRRSPYNAHRLNYNFFKLNSEESGLNANLTLKNYQSINNVKALKEDRSQGLGFNPIRSTPPRSQ